MKDAMDEQRARVSAYDIWMGRVRRGKDLMG